MLCMNEDLVLEKRLDNLRYKHRDLDEEIKRLMGMRIPDQLTLMRLKKQKLMLRDEINDLEKTLYPDIIA